MKLLFCKKCDDVFKLQHDNYSFCKCGQVGGKYIGELKSEYFEDEKDIAIPLGFNNYSFYPAIKNQRYDGNGNEFTAFVVPKESKTFIKIKKPSFL